MMSDYWDTFTGEYLEHLDAFTFDVSGNMHWLDDGDIDATDNLASIFSCEWFDRDWLFPEPIGMVIEWDPIIFWLRDADEEYSYM